MLPEWTVVGFSGHRKLAEPKAATDAIHRVFDRLAAHHGPLASVSSAASGADTLFVEEVARRNLPFRLILPFSKTRFQQDFTSADWQRVLPLMDKALIVEEISGAESDEEAYFETGILTVDKSDVMVFVWDSKPAAGLGGTGDVVKYARALNRPLVIIEPHTGTIAAEERLDQLPPQSVQTAWRDNPRAAVEYQFKEFDQTANRHAPKARNLVVIIIFLHLFAAAVGICALGLHSIIPDWAVDTASGVKIAALGTALVLAFQHGRARHEWMRSRIGAELCRSFLATWNLRRQAAIFPNMTLDGFEPLARSLRIAWYLDQTVACTLPEARAHYLKNRVCDQIRYFRKHCRRARFNFRLFKSLANVATIAAIGFSLLALFINPHAAAAQNGGNPGEQWMLTAKIFSLVLPLAGAAFMSVIGAQEYSRRGIRYDEMLVKLRGVARRLKTVQTWPGLFRVVLETENCLLQEMVEWHSFVRFAGEAP